MNEQQLQISCDADMSADECTLAKRVITDACSWLLDQPRQMGVDSCQPMFSEITFYVGRTRLSKGLRHRKTGKGWQTNRFNQILCVNSDPRQYFFDVPYEIALGGSVVYLGNQSFRCESYSDPDFRAEEHYQMQLKWLKEQHSPALYERVIRKIRADGVKQRNAARRDRKRKPLSQSARSPKSTDSQSLIHPPMNPRQAPVQNPMPAPTPELSEYQARVLAEHQALWDCVKSKMDDQTDTCNS